MSALNARHHALLNTLASGQFCSGAELAEALQVSRTTVANDIKLLLGLGLEVYKVKGRGYRLAKPLSMLDPQQLSQALPDKQISVLFSTESTNSHLQHLVQAQHGQVVVAEHQQAGRGRRGRQWQTPVAGQVCLSMLWQVSSLQAASGLSLVVGLAVVDALSKLGYQGLGLKWPNDIYCNGKKLGGILIELQGQVDGAVECIIGLGLNVQDDSAMAKQIEQAYCCLQQQRRRLIDRNQLIIAIISQLNHSLRQFEKAGLGPFLSQWQNYDCFYDQEVALIFSAERREQGRCKGIDANGHLLLETSNGTQSYSGGEVSLRKLS